MEINGYESARIRKWEPNKDASKVKLGKFEFGYRTKTKTGGSKATELDGISVYRAAIGRHDDFLYMLDCVCSPMEWRVIHAGLTTGATAKLRFRECSGNGVDSYRTVERDKNFGYRTYHERFMVDGSRANSKIHYLAISNNPGFMPMVDPTSVAFKLASTMFSTPFLSPALHGSEYSDWVPYIMDEGISREMLEYLCCFNCTAGLIHARESVLQDIVSKGVRTGALKWPAYDVKEIEEACLERDNNLAVVEAVEEDDEALALALPVSQ